MRLLTVSTLSLFLLLIGCVTIQSRPELPTSIQGKGLVIAEPILVGNHITSLGYADVIINGKKKGKVGNSHFAFVLPPGEYTLESFRRTLVNTTTYPMNLKFSIRAGEVTNLGQLLLVNDPEDLGQQRYFVFPVDNTEDTKYFLKTFYPKLFKSLSPNSIRLGLDNYKDGSELLKLRNYIIAQRLRKYPDWDGYIVGPAGIVAQIKRNNDKITGFELIHSPTMSGIKMVADHDPTDRFLFFTSDQRLYSIRKGSIQQLDLPSTQDLQNIFLTGKQDIVLCYKGFKLQISNNDGQTWRAFDGAAVKHSQYSKNMLVEDVDGYFIYNSHPAQILYSTYGGSAFKIIPMPEGVDGIKRLSARYSELFLETNIIPWTQKTPNPFYIKAKNSSKWVKKFMPRAMCDSIEFIDDSNTNLWTNCDQTIYRSYNSGTDWRSQ